MESASRLRTFQHLDDYYEINGFSLQQFGTYIGGWSAHTAKSFSNTKSRHYSFLMSGCCIRSRKPRREIFLKSRRQDTKRPLQFSALSLTSRGGVKRLEIRYSLTPFATASFTILTVLSSTAKNRCASGRVS